MRWGGLVGCGSGETIVECERDGGGRARLSAPQTIDPSSQLRQKQLLSLTARLIINWEPSKSFSTSKLDGCKGYQNDG